MHSPRNENDRCLHRGHTRSLTAMAAECGSLFTIALGAIALAAIAFAIAFALAEDGFFTRAAEAADGFFTRAAEAEGTEASDGTEASEETAAAEETVAAIVTGISIGSSYASRSELWAPLSLAAP